jgi:hypothetical protein
METKFTFMIIDLTKAVFKCFALKVCIKCYVWCRLFHKAQLHNILVFNFCHPIVHVATSDTVVKGLVSTSRTFQRLGLGLDLGTERLGLGLDLGTERLGLGLVSAEFSNVSVSSRVSRADVSGLVSVSAGKVSCTSLRFSIPAFSQINYFV